MDFQSLGLEKSNKKVQGLYAYNIQAEKKSNILARPIYYRQFESHKSSPAVRQKLANLKNQFIKKGGGICLNEKGQREQTPSLSGTFMGAFSNCVQFHDTYFKSVTFSHSNAHH